MQAGDERKDEAIATLISEIILATKEVSCFKFPSVFTASSSTCIVVLRVMDLDLDSEEIPLNRDRKAGQSLGK